MQQPRLTFIHGFMGHPSDWDDVCADLPEFDTSAIEVHAGEDWDSTVKQLAESIPDDSIIVGYSMGARLGLGVAIEVPHRCKGLIFVSGNPGLESETERKERLHSDQKLAGRIEADSGEPFLSHWYQSSVFANLPEEVRRSEIARKLARSSNDWPSILRACSVAKQPNYWPRLGELSMPTLIVAGELDEKYRNMSKRIREEVSSPNISVTTVPKAGHIVHREQQAALVQLICEFANKVA